MFYRKIVKEMERWAASQDHRPLVLRGARQVGKSTAVDLLSQQFDNYLSVNLERSSALQLMESSDDVSELVSQLFLLCGKQPKQGRTLIFIDEIQNSPKSVALLRYFYEDRPDLYVIAAGSLLETMLGKQISFPVGRVDFMLMHPCSFSEFLDAIGESRFVPFVEQTNLPDVFHQQLMKLYSTYMLVGGMPEAVAQYAETRDVVGLGKIYGRIVESYVNDAEKYATNRTQSEVIRYILSEGWQLAGETITLGGFAHSSYKAREVSESLRALEKAMLLELCYPITSAQLPALSNLARSPKLFWLDIGLVNFVAKIQRDYLFSNQLMDVWKGRAVEQMVAQNLHALTFDVNYKNRFWVRNKKSSSAEVDFVYQIDNHLIPIEVKSGHNAHLKSLHLFMDESNETVAVRVWSQPYTVDVVKTQTGKEFLLYNIPFYYIESLPKILQRAIYTE